MVLDIAVQFSSFSFIIISPNYAMKSIIEAEVENEKKNWIADDYIEHAAMKQLNRPL